MSPKHPTPVAAHSCNADHMTQDTSKIRRWQVVAVAVAGAITGILALIALFTQSSTWWAAAGIGAGVCALIGVSFAFAGAKK